MPKKRVSPPALGARLKASAYMVRYYTPTIWREDESGLPHLRHCVSKPEKGVWGWKRKRIAFDGVYIGLRRLKITWWSHFNQHGDEDRCTKAAAYLTAYLVAYSPHAAPRYVLPRDVEVLE